ncbi:hypothetical protein V0R37_15040 [Pollutimonas sp. H1-120]|uniref:hypothetical protein n=1 Tax=Pollutimonas sp. H1-120 TaxID=3148824 RepID=UPI003B526404
MQQQSLNIEDLALPVCLQEILDFEKSLDRRQHRTELSRAYRSAEAKSRLFAERLERHEQAGTGLNLNLPVFVSVDSVQAFEALANEFVGTCDTDPIADLHLTMFNNAVGGWLLNNIKTLDDLLFALSLLSSIDNEYVRHACAGRLVARLELDPLIVDPTMNGHREILEFLDFHNKADWGNGHDEFAAGFMFTKKIYARASLTEGVRWGLGNIQTHGENFHFEFRQAGSSVWHRSLHLARPRNEAAALVNRYNAEDKTIVYRYVQWDGE